MASWGVVVPVYNEADRIDEYVPRLAEWAAERATALLFVDDGSTDGTADRIEGLLDGATGRVLRRPHAGKGAAVAAGLRAVAGEVKAFCDLDLSTPLSDLARIVDLAARAPLLVIASRDVVGSSLVTPEGKGRETLGRAYNRLLQLLVTPGVVDTQCGAKAARASVWDSVLPHCAEAGFAWDAEVVATALRLGIDVREVPVAWTHDDRTRVRVLRDGVAMVTAAARIARRRLTPTPAPRTPTPATSPTSARPRAEGLSDHAQEMVSAGSRHWWFRSRAALVATALRRSGAAVDQLLIDVGAGPGWVTAMIGWDPDRAIAIEPDPLLATVAARSGTSSMQAIGAHLPLRTASCAVITLLDVIEHTEEPGDLLSEAHRTLTSGGLVVVLVPAHPWLWSATDEVMGHVRRYRPAAVRAELQDAGFEVVLQSTVFAWALPAVVLTRKLLGRVETGLRPTSIATDRLALVLTSLERLALGRIRVPFGASVLAVGRRGPD